MASISFLQQLVKPASWQIPGLEWKYKAAIVALSWGSIVRAKTSFSQQGIYYLVRDERNKAGVVEVEGLMEANVDDEIQNNNTKMILSIAYGQLLAKNGEISRIELCM